MTDAGIFIGAYATRSCACEIQITVRDCVKNYRVRKILLLVGFHDLVLSDASCTHSELMLISHYGKALSYGPGQPNMATISIP